MDFATFRERIIDSVFAFLNEKRSHLPVRYHDLEVKVMNSVLRSTTKEGLLRILKKYHLPYHELSFNFPIEPLDNKPAIRKIQEFLKLKDDMHTIAIEYFDQKEKDELEYDLEQPLFFIEFENCTNKMDLLELFESERIPKENYMYLFSDDMI